MSLQELINKTCIIFDEYKPSQGIDDDIKSLLKSFLVSHTNDFLLLLPARCVEPLIKYYLPSSYSTMNIPFNGGCIQLDEDILKLFSFKHGCWETTLFDGDVIDQNNPIRRRQENKFTAAKKVKPVVCLEVKNGKNSICFWTCEGAIDNVSISYISRLPQNDNGLSTFLSLKDDIITAYIYYCLSFVFETTKEFDFQKMALNTMNNLLSLYEINPIQPTIFNNSKK